MATVIITMCHQLALGRRKRLVCWWLLNVSFEPLILQVSRKLVLLLHTKIKNKNIAGGRKLSIEGGRNT